MSVTSRKEIWRFSEQLPLEVVPVLDRLQGRPAGQGCLRQLLVIAPHVAVQRGFQILARAEMVALQHLRDPGVEAFDPAVGLRVRRRGEAEFDAQLGAEPVERVPAAGAGLAQAEPAVGELAAPRHGLSDQWRTMA